MYFDTICVFVSKLRDHLTNSEEGVLYRAFHLKFSQLEYAVFFLRLS